MQRLTAIVLLLAVVCLMLTTVFLAVRVDRLEGELHAVHGLVVDDAAARAASNEREAAKGIVVTSQKPAIAFEDEAALADYAVGTRRELDALVAALERDIHDRPLLSRYALIQTHYWIDGRTWEVDEMTAAEASALANGASGDEPYLTFTEP
jgi:hypothetical protein